MIWPTGKTADVPPAGELERTLGEGRAREDAHRVDKLERMRAGAAHKRATADLDTDTRIQDLGRREREAAVVARARLARLHREALAAGERTRIESDIAGSGEARALRLERLRSLNIKILAPVLAGFAAWSTAGVQDGGARLMGITTGPVWWTLWLLEPVLITFVVWVIVARARLRSAGGNMEPAAEWLATAALTVSVLLNILSALPEGAEPWTGGVIGSVLAHMLGPLGAAATAALIGSVDRSIASADPWTLSNGDRAPRLAEMRLSVSAFDDAEDTDKKATPAPRPAAVRKPRKKAPANKARRAKAPPAVDDLMPLGRRIVANRGTELDRDELAAAVRESGQSISTDRARALLARLQTEAPEVPDQGKEAVPTGAGLNGDRK